MKISHYLLAATILFAACRKENCSDRNIYGIIPVGEKDSVVSYVVTCYEPGSSFENIVRIDSGTVSMKYRFSISAMFDWIVEVKTTGKKYYLKNMRYDQEKGNTNQFISSTAYYTKCVNTLHYNLNDTEYTMPGESYSSRIASPYKEIEFTDIKNAPGITRVR